MQPLTQLDAPGVPLPAEDIDTDQILPARFMHARRVDYGKYFFHDARADAGFVLNNSGYAGAQVLVVGRNFGCGSSREQAVHALADFGIRAIVGTTFGDIFFTNCLKNGVLPIRIDAGFVGRLLSALVDTPGAKVRVDLIEEVVIAPNDERLSFEIDAFQKEALVEGLDEIDMTLRYAADIDAYERANGIR
ncbi:3-isopropylmalate dehydratase small subunit [Paraburkholderia azotifigens]|uniref:3-isopropylmalate dehydratase small subunit n=1 Tax=Paraburkholderia azotifigens TaxID=2057004 RepID=UPI003171409F